MVPSNISPCEALEISVVLFQVAGVVALCLYRFFPGTRIALHSRVAFLLALFGLGIAGALCGRLDSEFALFAGGTMTVLLIGMTAGSSRTGAIGVAGRRTSADPAFAG